MSLFGVTGLTVGPKNSSISILNNIDLEIRSKKVTVLLGESGAGKTILCKTLSGLIPDGLLIRSGDFRACGRRVSHRWIQKNRGSFVFYAPQNASASLNPVRKIRNQLREVNNGSSDSLFGILQKLGFRDCRRILNSYPFELSGGENQRCLLAMAIILSPRLLIMDEPVTSLDVFLQYEFLRLVKDICRQHSMTVLLVTHNLELARDWSDYLYVMYRGEVVESGDFAEVMQRPAHFYTRKLQENFQWS
jgi:ABC-type dipeptide/oligopeptide/nickel transport system ATPase component